MEDKTQENEARDKKDSARWGGLIAGLSMIAVGAAFLLDRLDVVELEDLWHHWPWLLIVIGVVQVVRGRDWRSRRGGISTLIVGAWLLISVNELFDLSWHDSWPLLLVGFGLLWVYEGIVQPERRSRREVSDGR
jgi:cell wall-active antibiotic response 4TMS protein YvqF